DSGWSFCCNLTGTLRYVKPRLLQNAEFWPGEVGNYPNSEQSIVTPTANGGAGFDAVQHDGLRGAVRGAVQASSFGQSAGVSFDAIAGNLFPQGFVHAWQTVPCVENHDIVKVGSDLRIPVLADGSNHESWYARSRSRFATGLLLTAPGIPQLFMGQEFLEDKQWTDWQGRPELLVWWAGLEGADRAMVDQHRFTRDLLWLRRSYPALCADGL